MPAAIAYFNISESLVILSVIFHLWKKDEGKSRVSKLKTKTYRSRIANEGFYGS